MRDHLIWSGEVGTSDVSKSYFDYFLQVHLNYFSFISITGCCACKIIN